MSYDYVNHGDSSDSSSTKYTLMEDFEHFYEYMKVQYPSYTYGIIGFSMGSTLVIHGMANYPEIVAGIVDSGPLIDTVKYFNYALDCNKVKNVIERKLFIWYQQFIAGFRKVKKITKEDLKNIHNRPILFIHGTRDNIITPDNSELAIKLLPDCDAELWKIEGARHLTGYYLMGAEYKRRISNFFIEHLKKGDTHDSEVREGEQK